MIGAKNSEEITSTSLFDTKIYLFAVELDFVAFMLLGINIPLFYMNFALPFSLHQDKTSIHFAVYSSESDCFTV